MDFLDLVERIDEIELLFEPIYSADGHSIDAYKLITYIDNQRIRLEEFSAEEDVPEDIRAEMDQTILRKALKLAKPHLHDVNLHIPCNPTLLMLDYGEGYFNMLKEELDEEQLSRIVLVILEHQYRGDIKQLHHVIKYIKTYGVQISLSRVGAHSNLNKILLLEPNILNLHVRDMDYNEWGEQNYIFTALRTLALKIGASLMVSGIETLYQFQHGWKNGVHYYKGPHFALPLTNFVERNSLKEKFQAECKEFIVTEQKLAHKKFDALKELENEIVEAIEKHHPSSANMEALMALAIEIQTFAFRLYICDEEGFQTTPNIISQDGKWHTQKEAMNKNWSWRPYFLLNLMKLRYNHEGRFSSPYSDIETGELTRTFSFALSDNEYLFMDLSYSYLYEQNIIN